MKMSRKMNKVGISKYTHTHTQNIPKIILNKFSIDLGIISEMTEDGNRAYWRAHRAKYEIFWSQNNQKKKKKWKK